MELKYIVFFGVLIFGVPIGFILASKIKFIENVVLFIAVFFTCSLLGSINFVSMETYRGTAKGFQITLVDIAAIVLFLLVISRSRERKLILIPPGSILYLFYFVFSWISISNSAEPVYSYFELWKMVRMYFFYWTMCNYLNSEEDIMRMLHMIAPIIIYIFLVVLNQKYRMHIFQTNGPLPHQNSLVMYMIIFNTIIFAWLLNANLSAAKVTSLLAIFGMGSICVVSTLSRAGLMCYGLACGITMALSLINGFEFRKVAIAVIILFGAFCVLAKSMDSIIERFSTAPVESKLTRISLAEAAVKMADDKFFGVGLNNWGIKINPPYPYSDHIERKDDEFKEGVVETVYLLVAAETGWLNLAVFILFLMRFYLLNILNFISCRKTELMFISAALAGGLAGIYIESTLEWVLKQTNNFYQIMLVFAVISAMAELRRRKNQAPCDVTEQNPGSPETAMPQMKRVTS